MAPEAQHKLDFEQWLAAHGYGLSGRISSPEGERLLRKMCARLNPYAMEYRTQRQKATEVQGDERTPRSAYAPNSFWGKAGQLSPVEECGGGHAQDYFGLHKSPRPENWVPSRPILRRPGRDF